MTRSTRGAVTAGDPQTAEAGAELLREGGNAVDAAVAAAFAAFICELPLCSPLGGGVMLVSRPGEPPCAIDMFARTPGLGGERPQAMDFEHVEVDFGPTTQVFHVGRASAAVPLALPGLLEVHGRWGTRPLASVIRPAVKLGREGYLLGAGNAFVFRLLTPIFERTSSCRALHEDERGDVATAGARLKNPALAASLEGIGRNPASVRELYATLAREHGPGAGGLITDADVEAARPAFLEPITVAHRNWEIATMPGPSMGGALVALGLRLLEGVSGAPFLSRKHVLRVAAVQEALLATRGSDFDEAVRDPAAVKALLDEARIAAMRGGLPSVAGEAAPDNRLGSTTHVSVVDDQGTVASLTLTNGEGSGHVLADTGMIVNNLLGEEDIHPRGFHLDPPGKALSTMMAPTLVTREDQRIALGSGGSNRLRNAIMQVLVAMIEHGATAEAAVAAPRVHVEIGRSGRARIAFERPGMGEGVAQALVEAYPEAAAIFDVPNLYFGGVHVATADAEGFGGAGDPRRGGATVIV
jgi:gamma-glutamyltranspeptidase / glutathione hydrolase